MMSVNEADAEMFESPGEMTPNGAGIYKYIK